LLPKIAFVVDKRQRLNSCSAQSGESIPAQWPGAKQQQFLAKRTRQVVKCTALPCPHGVGRLGLDLSQNNL
jgi:hypothetical protein